MQTSEKTFAYADANFFGPFRVIMHDGTDITPGSQLRQAVLAVLCAAYGQIRSRKALQAMFWGAASADRASSNLRNTIYRLRQDLICLGPEVIKADRQVIILQNGVISANWNAGEDSQLLEGMDLCLDDCEGFEDWLRSVRRLGDLTGRGPSDPEGLSGKSQGADRLVSVKASERVIALERENLDLRRTVAILRKSGE